MDTSSKKNICHPDDIKSTKIKGKNNEDKEKVKSQSDEVQELLRDLATATTENRKDDAIEIIKDLCNTAEHTDNEEAEKFCRKLLELQGISIILVVLQKYEKCEKFVENATGIFN